MLVDSNLLHELEQNAFSPTGEPMCVFGYPAYPLRVHLQAPYRNGILRASLCKILISSFAHKVDFTHNFSVDFF